MENYTLKIIKNNLNAKILFDADIDENIISIVNVDKNNYALIEVVEGTKVTYTVMCDGYVTVTNSIIMDKDYEFIPELIQAVTLTIIPNPSDATIVLNYNGIDYEQDSLQIKAGEPITYTVSKINKQTVSDTTVIEKNTSIIVNLYDIIDNDKDIAEYEKNYSDDLNKINTISRKEYESLSDDLRSNYIKYTDLLTRLFGVDYNKNLNDLIVQLYWALPIANKLIPFTNGTLGNFQTDFINYLAQLNTLITSAKNVGDKIKALRKPLKKAGLSGLTDILTTGFGLIGGIGGIIYAIINNPNIFIKTFAQQFESIDIEDIYKRTIGETIPNLDYLKQMVNRTYLPDNELKKTLLYQLNEVSNMADLSLDVLNDLASLKELVDLANSSEDAMRTILENLSTMGMGWVIAYLSGLIDKLRKDKDKIKYNANNNNLSQAYDVMRNNIDNILNNMNDYYVHEDDLARFNKATNSRNKNIYDYQNGYNDGLNNGQNGETEEQRKLRLQKLKEEMEKLGKDVTPYLLGYGNGWNKGYEEYLETLSELTQLQKDSYNQGYIDGTAYSADIPTLVKNSLEMGDIKLSIDEDWHLHIPYNRYEPFGRIQLGIAYDNDGNVIGKLDVNNKIIMGNTNIGLLEKETSLPIAIDYYDGEGHLIYKNHQVLGTINENKVYNSDGIEIGEINSDNSIVNNDDVIIGYVKDVYYAIDKNKNKIGYVDEKGYVYDFHENMTEYKIGYYDSNTDILHLDEKINYYKVPDKIYTIIDKVRANVGNYDINIINGNASYSTYKIDMNDGRKLQFISSNRLDDSGIIKEIKDEQEFEVGKYYKHPTFAIEGKGDNDIYMEINKEVVKIDDEWVIQDLSKVQEYFVDTHVREIKFNDGDIVIVNDYVGIYGSLKTISFNYKYELILNSYTNKTWLNDEPIDGIYELLLDESDYLVVNDKFVYNTSSHTDGDVQAHYIGKYDIWTTDTLKMDGKVYDYDGDIVGYRGGYSRVVFSRSPSRMVGYVRGSKKVYNMSGVLIGYLTDDNTIVDLNDNPLDYTIENDYLILGSNGKIIGYAPKREEIYVRNIFYNTNLMDVQRKPKVDYINPHYAKGWDDGYLNKQKELNENNDKLLLSEIAYQDGYDFAQENKSLTDVGMYLDEYKETHYDDYDFYSQGFIKGYNTYQSEYNSTYSRGWYSAVESEVSYDFYYRPEDYSIVHKVANINDNTYVNFGHKMYIKSAPNNQYFGYLGEELENDAYSFYSWDNEEIGIVRYINGKWKSGLKTMYVNEHFTIFNENNEIVGYIPEHTELTNEEVIKMGEKIGSGVNDVQINEVGILYQNKAIVIDNYGEIIGELKEIGDKKYLYYLDTNVIKGEFDEDWNITPYVSSEEININKVEFMKEIIKEYNLEGYTDDELVINSYYIGASIGWDDSLNPAVSNQRYRKLYLDY